MASITITVPDSTVIRIRAAFGGFNGPATVNQIQDTLKAYIKDKVINYEGQVAAQGVINSASAEVW